MKRFLFTFLLVTILFFCCTPDEKDDNDDNNNTYNDGTDWDDDFSTAIKIDSKQRIHVAYSIGGSLFYACKVNNQWKIETIEPFVLTTGSTRIHLVVDSEGRPHIIANKDFDGMIYSTKKESGWAIEYFEKMNNEGLSFFDLAIDSKDRIKIIYPCDNSIYILYRSGEEWKNEEIFNQFSNQLNWHWISVAVDSKDVFHICFVGSDYRLFYLTDKTGQWAAEDFNPETGHIGTATLVVDSLNNVHIAYDVRRKKVFYSSNFTGE